MQAIVLGTNREALEYLILGTRVDLKKRFGCNVNVQITVVHREENKH
jgi:GTPase Era involved in 16S rRNA processing